MKKSRRLMLWFESLEPRVLDMLNGPFTSKLRPWVDQHDLFSFAREPLARGLAFGLFCSLIPGPLQIIGTVIACTLWRGNIIAGAVATFISNPITIVPIYLLAYQIGTLILPDAGAAAPSLAGLASHTFGTSEWFTAIGQMLQSMGWPLVLGLMILGLNMAALAYAMVQVFWLWPVHQRQIRMKRAAARQKKLLPKP